MEFSRDNANAQRRGWDRDRCAFTLDVRDTPEDVGMTECAIARERVVALGNDVGRGHTDHAMGGEAAGRARQHDVSDAKRRHVDRGDVQVLARADGRVHAVAGGVEARGDAATQDVGNRALERIQAATSSASRMKSTAE